MKIAFHKSNRLQTTKELEELRNMYGDHPPENADILVVLGGDGTMLHALHQYMHLEIPFYGLNLGTLGFLMNEFTPETLEECLKEADPYTVHPLRMTATDSAGKTYDEIAFNEVSLLRQTHSSAKIKISINETVRLEELISDGIMLSTPMGSTAYNLSVDGPIVPLTANVLPLTPISAFRPRRWKGALIDQDANVEFDILLHEERPVSVTADFKEVRNVTNIKIHQSKSISRTLLFAKANPLEERIFKEQFTD